MIKKIALLLGSAILLSALSGCTIVDYQGRQQLETARMKYEQLKSATVTITDTDKNQEVQKLVFQVDDKDYMLFHYTGTDGDKTYQEYHNGSELFYTVDGKWENHFYTIGQGNYLGYARKNRHALASGDIFFANDYAVKTSSVSNDGENTIITLDFDAEKMNETAKQMVEQNGSFVSFKTTYTLDKDGSFISHTQNAVFSKDGTESKLSYRIDITDINKPQTITKPSD